MAKQSINKKRVTDTFEQLRHVDKILNEAAGQIAKETLVPKIMESFDKDLRARLNEQEEEEEPEFALPNEEMEEGQDALHYGQHPSTVAEEEEMPGEEEMTLEEMKSEMDKMREELTKLESEMAQDLPSEEMPGEEEELPFEEEEEPIDFEAEAEMGEEMPGDEEELPFEEEEVMPGEEMSDAEEELPFEETFMQEMETLAGSSDLGDEDITTPVSDAGDHEKILHEEEEEEGGDMEINKMVEELLGQELGEEEPESVSLENEETPEEEEDMPLEEPIELEEEEALPGSESLDNEEEFDSVKKIAEDYRKLKKRYASLNEERKKSADELITERNQWKRVAYKLANGYLSTKDAAKQHKEALSLLADKYLALEDQLKAVKLQEAKAVTLNGLLAVAPSSMRPETKAALVKRFDSCKTIKEVKTLYEGVVSTYKQHRASLSPQELNETVLSKKRPGAKRANAEAEPLHESNKWTEREKREAWLSGVKVPGYDGYMH